MREKRPIIIVSDIAGVVLKGADSDKAYSNLAERTGIPEVSVRAVLRTHRGESQKIETILSPTIDHGGIGRAALLRIGFEEFWKTNKLYRSDKIPLQILRDFTMDSLLSLAAGYGLDPFKMPSWNEITSLYRDSFQVDTDVLDIYKKMSEKGRIIGALSNGRSWRWQMMLHTFPEVFDVFNGVVMSSHEFENEGDLKLNPEGIKKPDLRIFSKYEERAKLALPQNIATPLFLLIDDNKTNKEACAALPNWAGYHYEDSQIELKNTASVRLKSMASAFGWI